MPCLYSLMASPSTRGRWPAFSFLASSMAASNCPALSSSGSASAKRREAPAARAYMKIRSATTPSEKIDMTARMPATTMPKPSMEVTIPLRLKSSLARLRPPG